MAQDQVDLMRQLGHARFCLAGHDRGGRVAHRMALDHPETVLRVAVLDIAPTAMMYATTDRSFATAYYHRSEEHTSELQSLMRISYAVFCLKKKKKQQQIIH